MFSRNNFLWLGIFIAGLFAINCMAGPIVMSPRLAEKNWPSVVYAGVGIGWIWLCVEGARRKWLERRPPDDVDASPDGR